MSSTHSVSDVSFGNANPATHRSIFAAISEYFARLRACDELTSLSDRELDDIGMTRADIRRRVFG